MYFLTNKIDNNNNNNYIYFHDKLSIKIDDNFCKSTKIITNCKQRKN